MLSSRIRAALATSVAGAAALSTVALAAPAAQAAPTAPGPISGTVAYSDGSAQQNLIVAKIAADGTVLKQTTISSSAGDPVWSPTGNRVVYQANGPLWTAQPDGTHVTKISGGGYDAHPALTSDGSLAAFTRSGSLYLTLTDGTSVGYEWAVPGITKATGESDDYASFGANGKLAYERDLSGATDVYVDNAGQSSSLLVANAAHPQYSPDGSSIAFVRKDASGLNQLFVAAADGSTGLRQLTSAGNVDDYRWAPDGQSLFVQSGSITYQDSVTDGSTVATASNMFEVALAPTTPNHEVRLSGATVIDTAISESRYTWASVGTADAKRSQAKAVVITRQDKFYDAIPGSSLAVHAQAPLLYTPSAYLDSRTLAEVKRVLPAGGTVYLTGGTAALSPAVATSLAHAGFKVVRLGGATMWDTAVSIAKQVSSKPRNVLVLTGMNYLDAISAGATGQPIVLTNGNSMPTQTAAYLNSLTPATPSNTNGTRLWAVGGPGYRALIPNGYQKGMMPNWPSQISSWNLVGGTYSDTSLMVAQSFFAANTKVAVTTGDNWPDGLSGSAMMGHNGSPLLAFNPNETLYPGIASYLTAQSTSLTEIDMLGGTAAIPTFQQAQLAATLAGPTQYLTFTGGALPFARSHVAGASNFSASVAFPAKAPNGPVRPTSATR